MTSFLQYHTVLSKNTVVQYSTVQYMYCTVQDEPVESSHYDKDYTTFM